MYAYLAIGALVAVMAAGFQGYRLGADHTRVEYAARDIQQANENAAFERKIQEGRRAKEQAYSQALSKVSADYQGKLTDAQAKTTLALNAIRSGSVRLRDPYAKPETCGGSASSPATATSGRNGASTGELSGALAEYLVGLATEADRNTLQLTACQKALLEDRK